MFCISGFIHIDGIGEKPCTEHRESNRNCKIWSDSFNLHVVCTKSYLPGSTVKLLLPQRFSVGLLLSTVLVSSQWWILIYMFAVLIHRWVEILHADRTSMCIWTIAEPWVRLLQHKTVLIHRWVEVLHADRTSMCIWTTAEPRVRLLQHKTGLSPPPPPL